MKNIYLSIPEIKSGKRFAVATIIETEGSTPQKAGSSALFTETGLFAGTIGGGVLEGRVKELAAEAIVSYRTGIYRFNLDYDISFKQDAICGGNATVLVDVFTAGKRSVFEKIKRSLDKGLPGVLVTVINSRERENINSGRFWVTSAQKSGLPEEYSDIIIREAEGLLLSPGQGNSAGKVMYPDKSDSSVRIMFEPLFPPDKLIIAGAGHIGKVLAHIGSLLDFDVTVIDDRPEFASRENIPDADQIIVDDIGEALGRIDIRQDTFVVVVTRGHNDDAKALKACVNSDAAYLGMIGSRIKVEQMHQSFIENGWTTEERWSAVHAPVGLEINSRTVEEIVISIAAQLILTRNSEKR